MPPADSALAIEPVAIGPTWQRDESGWVLPERTLGWEVLAWTAEYLRQPDGPEAGARWNYTDEQVRLLLWWYALDESGRFVYRSGMLRRVKGWGKDPFAATLCAVEFVGPCRFDGWAEDGSPRAKPHPAAWVQTAAVSKDQTKNTMSLFPSLFADEAVKEFRLDIGKEVIYALHGKRRIEAVTSSPRSLEGGRATFILKNETQHWLSNNDGHEMAKVIARNTTKSRDGAARVLAISNAHEPGEDSDAEHDFEAYLKMASGKSRGKGFLYDSLEAPPDVEIADEEQLRAGLTVARGDSVWLDIDRHVEEIYDPRNSVATSRRFYLNQMVAAEDAWLAPHEYDSIVRKVKEELQERERITLGFDGSLTDDHSVLRACRVEDGAMFTIGAWNPEDYNDEAPREEIDEAVRSCFEKYRVVAFFSDLHPWESYVDAWARDFGPRLRIKASPKHAIAWDMRGRQKETTVEIERLHTDVTEGAFSDDGHHLVRQHFHNARRRPNAWGVSVGKEHRESKRKIDAVPATMLARMARRLAPKTGGAQKTYTF